MKTIRLPAAAAALWFFGTAVLAAQDAGLVAITVVKGDTLNNICRAYLVERAVWPKIAVLNRLANPNLIFPGQKIDIPLEYIGGFEDEGTVTIAVGEAVRRAKKDKEWTPLRPGDVVHSGDELKTGGDGGLFISFAGGNTLQLMPEARLTVLVTKKIDDLNIFQRILLGAGKAVARIKDVTGRSSRFEVKTPSAVAAARGTVFRVGLDETETTRAETLQGQIGVEAQAVLEIVGEGEGTIVHKDQAPQKPRKLPPPPAVLDIPAEEQFPPLRFRFSKVEEAAGYRVFLARDAEGREIILQAAVRPEDAAVFDGLLHEGTYYLIAQSIDADGLEGPGSAPVPVRVGIPLPPEPSSPVEGAMFTATFIDVVWPEPPRTGRYHLQIAEDEDFNRLVVDRTDLAAAVFRTPALSPGFYRLRASAVYGQGRESAFTAPRRFQIISLPDAPLLSEPDLSGRRVLFTCTNRGPGIVYRFQLARDDRFLGLVEERLSPDPEIAFLKPDEAGLYRARVAAVAPSGVESPFSAVRTFRVLKGGVFRFLCLIPAIALLLVLLI